MADIDTNTALIIASISAISAIIGASISSVTNYLTERQRNRNEEKRRHLQRQEQAYSQLTGLKLMTIQLYLSMNDAFYLFAWIEARERLQLPSRSDLGKIEEKHREYNELALELAKNNQRLFETIGLIQILFPPSEELEKLIEPFEPSIKKLREYRESIDYYEKATVENVDTPPYAVTTGLEEVIHEYVDIPFDALRKYLGEKIKAEKNQAKHWWRLWK